MNKKYMTDGQLTVMLIIVVALVAAGLLTMLLSL